ncbi:NAD-dependent epimerase/dehydratase family protein [uncultured Draconibacterium sp.]|uniref:NAD-dependent epimerase/dehydratase family protein n=1 Tax=uncultured Draconibacterium sp. TaxID=1573823 RepID=UPI002AA60B8E|nr:NAD-dependent epimerase/dehydratase family protein [uncultured Draconibacterium sp.]
MKVIITGATGMVGEGVLYECLHHNQITDVLVIGRKSVNIQHPKLREVIHADFYDLSAIQSYLKGYDACFFCLGVTSARKKEDEYYKLTHTLTVGFATLLSDLNPDMTFCYISGAGTDSSEKGKSMWARVKGKTENDLQKLPFKGVYCFRPAFIRPTRGLRNAHKFYTYVDFLYPVLTFLLPKYVCTLKELATAMINAASAEFETQILEVPDIIKIAKNERNKH